MEWSRVQFKVGDEVVCVHPRSDVLDCKGVIISISTRRGAYSPYDLYKIDYKLKDGKLRPCSHSLGFFVHKMEYFDKLLKGEV